MTDRHPTTTTNTTTTTNNTTTNNTTTTNTTTTRIAARTATRTMASPIGRLDIVARGDAIVSIRFEHEITTPLAAEPPVIDHRGDASSGDVNRGEHPLLDEAVRQLDEYFAGDRTEFDLPLDPAGTPFQRSVWSVLRQIPYGETISYGQQAGLLGDRNKSRAVGAANGKNPIAIVVPCHRVVGANGHLTGFAGGLENKAWLLDHERSHRR